MTHSRVTKLTSARVRAAYTASNTGNTAVADPPSQGRRQVATSPTHAAQDARAHKPLFVRIRVRCIPPSRWGFMQQPMAGMMPQMWSGATPQGWPQFHPGVYMNPNSPHTPTWGDDDELAETKPSHPSPGDWNEGKGKGRGGK